jgi:hypothetical protein
MTAMLKKFAAPDATAAAILAMQTQLSEIQSSQRAIAKQHQHAPAAVPAFSGVMDAALELDPNNGMLKALTAAFRKITAIAYGSTTPDAASLSDMYKAAKTQIGTAASVDEKKRQQPLIRLMNDIKAFVAAAPRDTGTKRKAEDDAATTSAGTAAAAAGAGAAATPAASAAAAAMAAAAYPFGFGGYGRRVRVPCTYCQGLNHLPQNCRDAPGRVAALQPPPAPTYIAGNAYGGGVGGQAFSAGGAGGSPAIWCQHCAAHNPQHQHTHTTANCRSKSHAHRHSSTARVLDNVQPVTPEKEAVKRIGPQVVAATSCRQPGTQVAPVDSKQPGTQDAPADSKQPGKQEAPVSSEQPGTQEAPVADGAARKRTDGQEATDMKWNETELLTNDSYTAHDRHQPAGIPPLADDGREQPQRTAKRARKQQRCVPAIKPLHALCLGMKRKRSIYAESVLCAFCAKRGHEIAHCPCTPTPIPAEFNRAERSYAQKLLESPRVRIETLKRNSPDETLKQILNEADRWNAGNPWANSTQIRDRLRARAGTWKAYGADKTLLSWIMCGARLPHIWKPQALQFPNHKSAEQNEKFVTQEIDTAVADGTFRVVTRDDVQVINPISVARNENGDKLRMCFDARWPNAHSPEIDFTLPSIERDLADTVAQHDEMVSADITKAYHSIPIAQEAIPYLAIEWKGRIIVPTVLPFGSNLAPFIFNRITRQVIRVAQMLGRKVMSFYDDWLFAAPPAEAKQMSAQAQTLILATGWRVNAKCVWSPATIAKFLGFIINSTTYRVSVTPKRIERAKASLAKIAGARNGDIPLNEIESFAGMATSMRAAIAHAVLFVRSIHRSIHHARDTGANHVTLAADGLAELAVWKSELSAPSSTRIVPPGAVVELHVDAGELAVGATTSSGLTISEPLPTALIGASSTARELFGVLRAVETWQTELRNRVVRLNLDSFAAIRNLVKGGGPVEMLVRMCKGIWNVANASAIYLKPQWIPREWNSAADALSKPFRNELEWSPGARTIIADALERCNRERAHGTRVGVALPALNEIAWTAQRLKAERANTLIAVPYWHAQSWLRDLQKHARNVWELGNAQHVWVQAEGDIPFPRWRILLLWVDFTVPPADTPI